MSKEAMKLALEALHDSIAITMAKIDLRNKAIKALEKALANHCEDNLNMVKQEQGEPVAIHQYRSPHCADWYDGIPDHHDGHGPYEVRTLYTTPQPKQEQGEPVGKICAACGSTMSDESLAKEKEKNADLISCCPERKMVNVYTDPQPKREQQLLETFWRIVEYLGIEDEFAKNPKGKPSDVFIEAIKKREAQPKRKPLTDEQIKHIYISTTGWSISDSDPMLVDFARAIEAKLKEKNT